mgnify:CR=1 FL=1
MRVNRGLWRAFEQQFWTRRVPGPDGKLVRVIIPITRRVISRWGRALDDAGFPRETIEQSIRILESRL